VAIAIFSSRMPSEDEHEGYGELCFGCKRKVLSSRVGVWVGRWG